MHTSKQKHRKDEVRKRNSGRMMSDINVMLTQTHHGIQESMRKMQVVAYYRTDYSREKAMLYGPSQNQKSHFRDMIKISRIYMGDLMNDKNDTTTAPNPIHSIMSTPNADRRRSKASQFLDMIPTVEPILVEQVESMKQEADKKREWKEAI